VIITVIECFKDSLVLQKGIMSRQLSCVHDWWLDALTLIHYSCLLKPV